MSAAQPDPELDALLQKVRAQVRDCQLTEAILVDDKLDTDLTEPRWIEAVGRLRTDDKAAYENLRQLIGRSGTGNVEELPPDDILDDAVKLVHDSTCLAAKTILTQVRFGERALESLISILQDVGLRAICRTRVTKNDPPRDGKLYFLDYRMQGNDATAGLDACELLIDLVNRPGEAPPPAAVLMSRGQNQHPTQADWEKVARHAGYYRFNFRYLDKEKLQSGKMPFLFFLHEMFAALPLGTNYYGQLKKLKQAADTAAGAALAKIRQLSPAEFSIFAGKHLGDGSGRKATRHVLDLFIGLLESEVKDNKDLEESFRGFADMLRSTPMLATTDTDSQTLHQLHNQLLYDRSRWVRSGPVEFGDIYHRAIERGVYYLVLTPECDLELRYRRDSDTWAPKAEDILLLRGEVKDKPPDKNREDVIGKPFASGDSPRWIWWMLRKRVIVPSRELVVESPDQVAGWPQLDEDTGLTVYGSHEGRYLKWGRLRLVDAEEIQQKFVSDLAAVGTDEVSGKINLIPVNVWHSQPGQPDKRLGDLIIVEVPNPKDDDSPYWAFGEGCEPLFCPESPADVILPLSELLELRRLQPKKLFLDKCRKKKLYPVEREPFCLVRSQKSVPANWKPPTPVPPAPDVAPEPAAEIAATQNVEHQAPVPRSQAKKPGESNPT